MISIPFESWGTSSRGEQTPTGVKMNTEAWASRGFSELDFLALWVLESDQVSKWCIALLSTLARVPRICETCESHALLPLVGGFEVLC